MWTQGNTRETQTQEQSPTCSHLSVCVWTRGNTRETQTQEQSPTCSHLSVCVWTRGNPGETQEQSSPAVMSVKGKTQMLSEGEGDEGRERSL